MADDDKTDATLVAAEDAFNAGFDTPDKDRSAPQPAPVTETPAAVEEKKTDPEFVQISAKEWADIKAAASKTAGYDQQLSKAFGTIGQMSEALKKLREAQTKATEEAASAAYDRLKSQWPELAEGVKELVDSRKPEVTKATLDQIKQEEEARRLAVELEALEFAHPEWKTLVGAAAPGEADPEHPFRVWLSTKGEKYKDYVSKTESAIVMLKAIDQYQAETKPKAKPAQARADLRREQMAAAVQPRGDGGLPAAPGADDAFLSGFNNPR